MNYKIDIGSDWKFQYGNKQLREEYSTFGKKQLQLRGSWIMSILKFVFPYGIIFATLIYLQLNETLDDIFTYCIYALEVCIFCYLIYLILKNFRKKVIFYESGMTVKNREKEIDIPYHEMSNILIEKTTYNNATSVQHWMNSVIPITVISISTKDGISVSLTTEDFIDAEIKIRKFIKRAGK